MMILKMLRKKPSSRLYFPIQKKWSFLKKWCLDNEGEYNYDKENSCQKGKLPSIESFKDEICWCDIMTFYLLHVAGYSFYSTIHPYKGEVYIK